VIDNEELIESLREEVDLVVGGPPCQSISKAGYRARRSKDDNYSILEDERTHLYSEYLEFVKSVEPDWLLMENVEGLIEEVGDSEYSIIEDIISEIESAGYVCKSSLVDALDYGVPQERRRVLIVGRHEDAPAISDDGSIQSIFSPPCEEGEKVHSIKSGLSGLPKLRRGEGGDVIEEKVDGRRSRYVYENNINTGTELVFNHQAREHPMEKDRTLFDDVMEPGDTGWMIKYEKGRDDLIDYYVGTEENPAFEDKYRMLYWDKPSPTVVAHLAKDANNFILPDYYQAVQKIDELADDKRNRGVTPREAARLQSFPDDYIFLGPFTSHFRQIGNAVPPLLAKKIAKRIFRRIRLSDHTVETKNQAAADD
jgi:DNA (cytosine-5)-methyltransferase 1